jgi:hypothetical protein
LQKAPCPSLPINEDFHITWYSMCQFVNIKGFQWMLLMKEVALVENEWIDVKNMQNMDVLISITNLQNHNFNKGNPFFIKTSFFIFVSVFFLLKLWANGGYCIKGVFKLSLLLFYLFQLVYFFLGLLFFLCLLQLVCVFLCKLFILFLRTQCNQKRQKIKAQPCASTFH